MPNKKLEVLLVKPHPVRDIIENNFSVPEINKYNWEPLALKMIANYLDQIFHNDINLELWHLITKEDDKRLLDRIMVKLYDMIIFTEIDILVNEVNRIAVEIKNRFPKTITIVGGKQTSLLQNGDKSPFEGIDYLIKGHFTALKDIIGASLRNHSIPDSIQGLLKVNQNDIIIEDNGVSEIDRNQFIDNTGIHEVPVQNHDLAEYIEKHQNTHSIIAGEVRTSLVLTGIGCGFKCTFCQSPMEYGRKFDKPVLYNIAEIAKEIVHMQKKYDANNFFSIQPNTGLEHLLYIYGELEILGVDNVAISGFVRAKDIVVSYRKGYLEKLTHKGMRVLHIGLDFPLMLDEDVYNKGFSIQELIECLNICVKSGIIVIGSVVDFWNVRFSTNSFCRLGSGL